jgi:hypothetical protein
MNVLTVAEIDHELASRTKEVAELSTTLVELDSHPGHELVRHYPPTGTTAERWATIQESLAQLWADLASVTPIVESAQAVRGRRSRLDDDDRTELTKLLCDSDGLADALDRMRATYPGVAEFFHAVEEINAAVADGIAPALKRLDAAGVTVPDEVADLLAVAATDPLSLTVHEVERRIATIEEIIELHENWPDAIATAAAALDTLRDAEQHAAKIRARAEQAVMSGPLPVHTDTDSGLRAELESMTGPDASALLDLQRRIDSALQLVRRDEQLAQGLLDRRTELKGRLKAYEAKATRLGLAEDPELLSSSRIAAGLLSRQPCDLRAVTRAIADYQQMVAEKRGRTP